MDRIMNPKDSNVYSKQSTTDNTTPRGSHVYRRKSIIKYTTPSGSNKTDDTFSINM